MIEVQAAWGPAKERTDVEVFNTEMHRAWWSLPAQRAFNVMIFCDLSWQLFGTGLKSLNWISHLTDIYWTHSKFKKFLNCFKIPLGRSVPRAWRLSGFFLNTSFCYSDWVQASNHTAGFLPGNLSMPSTLSFCSDTSSLGCSQTPRKWMCVLIHGCPNTFSFLETQALWLRAV